MRYATLWLVGMSLLLGVMPRTTRAQTDIAGQVVVSTVTDTLSGGVGGVAVDRMGVIYVADFGEKVWKITPWGDVEVFANTLYGASGNAIDPQGTLFQSNFYGNTISKITRDGTVTTYASEGLSGPVGIAINAQGELFVCNCNNNTIARVAPDGTATTFSESSLFRCPNGITFGPGGDLYVVNFSDEAMIKVTPEGEASHFATIPGGGNGHLVASQGNFYVTSFQGHQVFLVSTDGKVVLLAGTGEKGEVDGPHDTAVFSQPNGIAVSFNGSFLYTNDFVRRGGTQGPSSSLLRRISIPNLFGMVNAALTSGGVEAATQAYQAYKNDSIFGISNTEPVMNFLGYQLMNQGRLPEAIAIFKLNVDSYPASWNVYDSLGEAYKNAGETKQAIRNYEKSIELNPENSNGAQILKELRGH